MYAHDWASGEHRMWRSIHRESKHDDLHWGGLLESQIKYKRCVSHKIRTWKYIRSWVMLIALLYVYQRQ